MKPHVLLIFAGVLAAAAWANWTALGQPPLRGGDVDRRLAAVENALRIPDLAGDGKTDDADALQRAIDSGRGLLEIPPGTYRLTKTLLVDLAKTGPFAIRGSGSTRLVMEGAGPAIRLVGTHGGTADPKSLKPGVWEGQRTPLVDGLEIFGAHPESCGVALEGTMQPTITRVTVKNALHGIHIVKRNRNVQISDCHLYDNRGIGVYLDDVNLHQINIVGCHISYNGRGGVVVRKGEVRNIQIGTCDIESNMAIDGPPAASVLFDVSEGGTIREGAIVGCTIQHKHGAANSASVRLLGRAGLPEKVGNLTVSHNVFSDVQVGIDLQHARGVNVVGNTFMECYDASVKGLSSSNLVMSANLIDRNIDYKDEVSSNRFYFESCRDSLIDGCHFAVVNSPDGAIVLKSCDWFRISDCVLLDCASTRISLGDSTNCEVSDCVFRPRKDEPPGDAVTADKTASR